MSKNMHRAVEHDAAEHSEPARNNMPPVRIIGVLIFLLVGGLSGNAGAQTYNWHFSSSNSGNLPQGNDTNSGTEAAPFRSLSKAQDMLDSLGDDDYATLWFDRGDTWDASQPNNDVNGRVTSWSSTYDSVLRLHKGHVTLDAYGSGPKPVFAGGTTTWDTNPLDGGCHKNDSIISMEVDGCRVNNLEIKDHFGHGIAIKKGGLHEVRHCHIHNMGSGGIHNVGPFSNYGTHENIIEYNEVAYVQRSYEFGYKALWSNAIGLEHPEEDPGYLIWGNQVRYNYVHHSFGEGIAVGTGKSPDNNGATPSIIEYNLVGDTKAPALHPQPRNWDAGLAYIRHNLVFSTGGGLAYGYDGQGVAFMDEMYGGDNSDAEYHFYGNVVVGRHVGLWLGVTSEDDSPTAPYGKLYIYNNTFIDCYIPVLFRGGDKNEVIDGRILNNTFSFYDLTGRKYVYDFADSNYVPWTISNNHFFGGPYPVPSPWDTYMLTGDPAFPRTSGWRSLPGAPGFSDVIPQAGSALIGTGETLSSLFEEEALTSGTDFNTLPSVDTFVITTRGSDGYWEVGAAETGGGSSDSVPPSISVTSAVISGTAADNSGEVTVSVDGSQVILNGNAWSCEAALSGVSADITISAFDPTGNEATVTLGVWH